MWGRCSPTFGLRVYPTHAYVSLEFSKRRKGLLNEFKSNRTRDYNFLISREIRFIGGCEPFTSRKNRGMNWSDTNRTLRYPMVYSYILDPTGSPESRSKGENAFSLLMS